MTEEKIDNWLKAVDCDPVSHHTHDCKNCPYGYGYLDNRGDNSFWWCDEEKILNDAVEIIKHLRMTKVH